MDQKHFFTLIFLILSNVSFSQKLTWTSIYEGKNIYVHNPVSFANKDTSFCTIEVLVNNMIVPVNLQSSAYEIDLSYLKSQDTFRLIINHKPDCKPKVLNPFHRHRTPWSWKDCKVNDSLVKWSISGKLKDGNFYLEHFRNNSWLTIHNLPVSKDSIYQLPVAHHSKINKYRLKLIQKDGQVFYSMVLEYFSDQRPLKIDILKEEKRIVFTRSSQFELLDNEGRELIKGNGMEINISQLKPGTYYLNADNQTFKVKIK